METRGLQGKAQPLREVDILGRIFYYIRQYAFECVQRNLQSRAGYPPLGMAQKTIFDVTSRIEEDRGGYRITIAFKQGNTLSFNVSTDSTLPAPVEGYCTKSYGCARRGIFFWTLRDEESIYRHIMSEDIHGFMDSGICDSGGRVFLLYNTEKKGDSLVAYMINCRDRANATSPLREVVSLPPASERRIAYTRADMAVSPNFRQLDNLGNT